MDHEIVPPTVVHGHQIIIRRVPSQRPSFLFPNKDPACYKVTISEVAHQTASRLVDISYPGNLQPVIAHGFQLLQTLHLSTGLLGTGIHSLSFASQLQNFLLCWASQLQPAQPHRPTPTPTLILIWHWFQACPRLSTLLLSCGPNEFHFLLGCPH